MILNIVLFVLLILVIALVVFFLVCALVPAVKEQTKIDSNAIFSKIEEDSVVLYRDIEQVEKHDSKAYVLCSCNKKFPNETNSPYQRA